VKQLKNSDLVCRLEKHSYRESLDQSPGFNIVTIDRLEDLREFVGLADQGKAMDR
jgi:hypothetical protein